MSTQKFSFVGIASCAEELALSASSLLIYSGENCARLIDSADEDEVRAYQKLRYDCFVLRKGWVAADPNKPECETDCYDPYCHHLGVFRGSQLVAYVRTLPWQPSIGFMLNHEFQDLINAETTHGLKQGNSIEISRLVVAPPSGYGRSEATELAQLLFKMIFKLGKLLEWDGHYIVLEESWLRILNRRFHLSFAALGTPRLYPDGTRALAACARRKVMEQALIESSPDQYRWYCQDVVS